ncbi:MAG: nuclear transport factor 2 family protein [Sphingobacteriia bacterium]|nr:nuclear transport factor 2 family protein [Sphingobacteriia bacterium]
MKTILTIAILSFSVTVALAQPETDAIKQTVSNLFIAMKTGDSALLRSCFTDTAILQTILVQDHQTIIRNETVTQFAHTVSRLPKGAADERIVFGNIQQEASLATVWAPYRFYFQNIFSHCGVDHFVLIKSENKWKIQYLIDTRRKTDCDAP